MARKSSLVPSDPFQTCNSIAPLLFLAPSKFSAQMIHEISLKSASLGSTDNWIHPGRDVLFDLILGHCNLSAVLIVDFYIGTVWKKLEWRNLFIFGCPNLDLYGGTVSMEVTALASGPYTMEFLCRRQ